MLPPSKPVEIIIVGGGTAGWLTAAFLSRQLALKLSQPIKITLVEASDIPSVGVGEATIPTIKDTLAACGIVEREFLESCSATFKHGIEFIQWRNSPQERRGESYFHPFGAPLKVGAYSPVQQWTALAPDQREAFADAFSVQPEMAKKGYAPKHPKDADYDGALAYAYHLDAGKFAQFLKQKFRGAEVTQIIDTLSHVDYSNTGDISKLSFQSGRILTADLYIDCTGFAARLINADNANPFRSKNDQLFVDRAVTTQLAHSDPQNINGYTKCTAQTSGWIWDIALQNRRGIGHVYASKYIDDHTAKKQLCAYLGQPEDTLETRQLDMRIGYHSLQWRGNCVSIGLASGFLEPLESTGIYLIEMANWALLELLPRYLSGVSPQAHYNTIMHNHYENITDFLKLHYFISDRDDSAFWRDNKKHSTISKTLLRNLHNWQNTPPSIYDFDKSTQCFSMHNYQFVLYGMGWAGHTAPSPTSDPIITMLDQLAVRRERLKHYVTRDTIGNMIWFGK